MQKQYTTEEIYRHAETLKGRAGMKEPMPITQGIVRLPMMVDTGEMMVGTWGDGAKAHDLMTVITSQN